MCTSCQENMTCKSCKYVVAQEIDLRSMVLYTQLPELWDIFRDIIAISPMTEIGFTLLGASDYLAGYDLEALQVTHREFWKTMIGFLSRINSNFLAKKKAQAQRNK